ncbi:MAG: hypothetical protein LQ352_005327 [Teloschistes flavicans]|nr:MAG: hypothetical protein LQ352_005327 [Teloschistes flavicans]
MAGWQDSPWSRAPAVLYRSLHPIFIPGNTCTRRGIGRGIALELARRGANVVVITYKPNSEAANKAVKELEELKVKPSRPFGKLDIVVSNAGIDEVTPQDLHRVFAVNTRGQLLIAQQAYKHCNYGGRLILLSCMGANARGIKDHTIYQGQQSFYRSLRQFSYLRIWFSTYLILQ